MVISQKGDLIELYDLEALGISLIHTRKEVKNTSLIRNFVSSYEDRFVSLIPVKGQMSFVVFKKNAPSVLN